MERFNCKNSCTRLDALLTGLIQIFQQICLLNLQQPKNEQNPIYEHFLNILMKGVELVKKCEKTSRFDIFHNVRYASQIHQLEEEISDFLQYQMPVNILLDVKNLITELNSLRHLYELGSFDENKMNVTISKLTSDPHQNAMMLQQMGGDYMIEGDSVEAPCSCDGLGTSDFVVGLEKNIWNLKRILLQREVSVVGMQCMGGAGKTTMALALCNDKEIKGDLDFLLFKPFLFPKRHFVFSMFAR
jgi:hypothetical protein